MESKSGKDIQFDSIYQAYKNSIFKVAMHYADDEYLAEEIAQQAFFQLYIHFENTDLDYVFPWLITTAKNLALNYMRVRKHEILGDVFDITKEKKDRFYYIHNMEDEYIRDSQKRLAENLETEIFERLSEEHKKWYDAVSLVYSLGKSQKEAAKELGIAVEVLNSRLYRARQWIRKNYGEKYDEVFD